MAFFPSIFLGAARLSNRDPPSSIFCFSAFRHLRCQPFCRAQQARVPVARADELNAKGKTVGALQKRQIDAGHAAERPERAEGRSEERRVGKECRSRWSP